MFGQDVKKSCDCEGDRIYESPGRFGTSSSAITGSIYACPAFDGVYWLYLGQEN